MASKVDRVADWPEGSLCDMGSTGSIASKTVAAWQS